MRFVAYRVGKDPVIAEGDPNDPRDQGRLSAEFDRLLAAGMWATVPSARLDVCCRRGLTLRRFSDVPESAQKIVFFRRCVDGKGRTA